MIVFSVNMNKKLNIHRKHSTQNKQTALKAQHLKPLEGHKRRILKICFDNHFRDTILEENKIKNRQIDNSKEEITE